MGSLIAPAFNAAISLPAKWIRPWGCDYLDSGFDQVPRPVHDECPLRERIGHPVVAGGLEHLDACHWVPGGYWAGSGRSRSYRAHAAREI